MQVSDKIVTFDNKENNQSGFIMPIGEKQEGELNQAMLDVIQERIYNELKQISKNNEYDIN